MVTVITNLDNLKKLTQQKAPEAKSIDAKDSKQAQEVEKPDVMPEDKVEISAEAKKGSVDFQGMLDEMRDKYRMLREDMKRAQEAGDGMAEAMKEKIRCLQIAMRIMSGDNVPIEDERYLAEKDIELYHQAKTMRIEKEDPKDHDRLSEDEKKKKDDDEIDSTGDSIGSGVKQIAVDTAPAETAAPKESGDIQMAM